MTKPNSVLVVEDEAIVLMDLQDALADAGFDVVTAQNLSAAEEAVGKQRFHWGLLDYSLADGSTLPIARALHDVGTSIVFISGSTIETDILQQLSACQFQKPFDLDEICAHLNGEDRVTV